MPPRDKSPRDQYGFSELERRRFWRWVPSQEPGRCWLWSGLLSTDGYGKVQMRGKTWRAHRVSLAMTGARFGPAAVVMHACDVRTCVNPEHLIAGSAEDNFRDMVRKGRKPHGSRHWRAKITEADVVAIRQSRLPVAEIMKRWPLSETQARRVLSGDSWAHVRDGGSRP